MHVLLVGNYGVGNLGDEALKHYMLRTFPEVTWTVVSACPGSGEVPRLPGGIRSLCTTPWWRTIRVYRSVDRVVFGGGTLFTDIESPYACVLWFLHAFLARLFGKPVLLAFQGIGPFRTRRGEWLARRTASAASFLSVRDPRSLAQVASWGLNSKVVQTFDPIYKEIYSRKSLGTKNLFILIPRENSGDAFRESAMRQLRSRKWDGVHILSFAPSSISETTYCRELGLLIPDSVLVPVHSIDTLLSELSGAAFVLTERFHGAVAALALGLPFAVISRAEGDKLAEMEAIAQSDGAAALMASVLRGEDALREALR